MNTRSVFTGVALAVLIFGSNLVCAQQSSMRDLAGDGAIQKLLADMVDIPGRQ